MSAAGHPLVARAAASPVAPVVPGGAGLRYGALAAPLAFAALPLYVALPAHYGATLGVPLAALGAVLLAGRVADALIDPGIGRLADRLLDRPRAVVLRTATGASVLLVAGLALLFFPPWRGGAALLAGCAATLALTSLACSTLVVLHQAWGARLGGGAVAQSRWVAWREGSALAGVLAASLLVGSAGPAAMVAACAVLLAVALPLLATARWPDATGAGDRSRPTTGAGQAWQPWQVPAFRRLMAVFVLNGVAAAVPATLVLFFVQDRLQASALASLFLGGYFAAAAVALPAWVRGVAAFGLLRCWLAGMLMSVLAFVGAVTLGAGDAVAFAVVCAASGAALGADLVAPGALLAGIARSPAMGPGLEGTCFGWWTCLNKLNLALAAGLALPLLQALGYTPGARSAEALSALTLAYALLPCLLKLGAAALLWRSRPILEPAR